MFESSNSLEDGSDLKTLLNSSKALSSLLHAAHRVPKSYVAASAMFLEFGSSVHDLKKCHIPITYSKVVEEDNLIEIMIANGFSFSAAGFPQFLFGLGSEECQTSLLRCSGGFWVGIRILFWKGLYSFDGEINVS